MQRVHDIAAPLLLPGLPGADPVAAPPGIAGHPSRADEQFASTQTPPSAPPPATGCSPVDAAASSSVHNHVNPAASSPPRIAGADTDGRRDQGREAGGRGDPRCDTGLGTDADAKAHADANANSAAGTSANANSAAGANANADPAVGSGADGNDRTGSAASSAPRDARAGSGSDADADSQGDFDETPVTVLLRQLAEGAVSPRSVAPVDRQRCVEHLEAEGFTLVEIARVLRVSERTIRRDVGALRQRDALSPSLTMGDEVLGQMLRLTHASIQRLTRLARNPEAKDYARLWADTAIPRLFGHLVHDLIRLGYLPSAGPRVSHLTATDPATRRREKERLSALGFPDLLPPV